MDRICNCRQPLANHVIYYRVIFAVDVCISDGQQMFAAPQNVCYLVTNVSLRKLTLCWFSQFWLIINNHFSFDFQKTCNMTAINMSTNNATRLIDKHCASPYLIADLQFMFSIFLGSCLLVVNGSSSCFININDQLSWQFRASRTTLLY